MTNKTDIPFFGIIVKKRLIELDMTQRELARSIGVNENYLTDILKGRRSGKKYKEAILETLEIDSTDGKTSFLTKSYIQK
ncbi:helix-turn-helix transcriptional regulator [Vallitalea pronyensis]|uniref:Helix-turn-helix transcriptional regulator n=1 Tax=Vallitalea pronyensis TaxID=1348613 RepID=A0A8J8MJ38_9FIRM|nr:helix-turn-helix transcriptional regulator [Vallitalea pronyensis]QUI22580.1 helix-turn-helix transcriptional regulator [Vallitalea pronyensis]